MVEIRNGLRTADATVVARVRWPRLRHQYKAGRSGPGALAGTNAPGAPDRAHRFGRSRLSPLDALVRERGSRRPRPARRPRTGRRLQALSGAESVGVSRPPLSLSAGAAERSGAEAQADECSIRWLRQVHRRIRPLAGDRGRPDRGAGPPLASWLAGVQDRRSIPARRLAAPRWLVSSIRHKGFPSSVQRPTA
jgi:hypothetical protein